MLSARGLGRRFGARWIFRGLDLELGPGDVLVVRGRNGAGKSTLLKVLAGLLARSEGELVRPEPVGYAALDLALYPALSGLEHLELAAALRGDRADPRAALAEVGLADAADRPAGDYSSGMRARLRLALATAADPGLLILDEPSAALDDEGRAAVARALAAHAPRGPAVVATNDARDHGWATHELAMGG